MNKKNGFTPIEILLILFVIGIIGIIMWTGCFK